MVDLMTSRLLDVREVFGRLDKQKCGECLEPGIDAIAEGVAADLFAASRSTGESSENEKPLPRGARRHRRRASGGDARRQGSGEHGKRLVASVLGEMQQRVPEVWDVKTVVAP